MSQYTQKVRTNILPLSVASTLLEAFKEWSFTENTVDHEEPTETCQLCDQEDVRYHFEIRNALTGKTLWVGSQCILKFGVSVFEDGRRLSATDAKKKLNKLIRKMHYDYCVRALSSLTYKDQGEALARALERYEMKKSLTPPQGAMVLWLLKKNNINHKPSFFAIDLRRETYKESLANLKPWQICAIWPALTPAQRKIAIDMGHETPRT